MPSSDELLKQFTSGKQQTPTATTSAVSTMLNKPVVESPAPTVAQPNSEEDLAFQLGSNLRDILTNKQTLPTLWESLKTGGKKTLAHMANIGMAIEPYNPLALLLKGKEKIASQQAQTKPATEKLFEEAKATKEQYLKDKSGGQGFVYDVGEFIPPAVVTEVITLASPIPGDEKLAPAVGLAKLLRGAGKFVTVAGREIAESQLVYNPKEHEGENQVQARLNDAIWNVAAWGATQLGIKGTKKVAETLVVKPMQWAVDTIADRQIKRIEAETLDSISPFINGGINDILDSDKIKLDRATFLDTVKGIRPIDDATREFFSTPEWKAVAKKYGTEIASYPDVVKVTRVAPVGEVMEAKGIMGLLSAPKMDVYNTIAADVVDIANKAARMSLDEVEQKTGRLGLMMTTLDAVKDSYGMKIDREGIASLIGRLTNNVRAIDDFNMGVANLEMRQGLFDTLNAAGLAEPLLKLKKLSSGFLAEKADVSPDNFLSEVFDKSLKGSTDAGELIDQLNLMGFRLNDVSDLIDFARSMPSKTELKKLSSSLKSPETIDVDAELKKLITMDTTVKQETPYLVAKREQSMLEQQLLSKETTQLEQAKPVIDEAMSKEVKETLDKATVAINQTTAPEPVKVSVSQATYNMSALADPSVPAQAAFDAMPSYAAGILSQIKNIAEGKNIGEGEFKSNVITALFEKTKSFLFNNKVTGSLFSAQSKQLSTDKSIAKVNSMYRLIDENLKPLLIAERRLEDELYKRLRPETFSVFSDAIEKNTFDNFTPAEKEAVEIWQSYARNILRFTNTLRVALGKEAIPESERYFPRQIQDVIKSTLMDTLDNEKMLNEFDSRAIYKRTLENLSTAIHEKDIKKILPIYFKSNMLHINSLVRQMVNKETNDLWVDAEVDAFKARMRMSAWSPDVEEDWAGTAYDIGNGIGNAVQNIAESMKLKKVDRVPLSAETKEWLLSNEKLSGQKAIKDVIEKGYFEVRDSDWGKFMGKVVSAPTLLSSTFSLMLNQAFTSTNMLQPLQAQKVFGISALPAIARAWTKAYIFNTGAELLGVTYAKEEKGMLEVLGYLGAKQSVYGEGLALTDFLGKFGRGLTLNITWTERSNRLASMFMAEELLSKRVDNLSKAQLLRASAEISAAMNFVAGKYTNPSIKTSWLGRQLYQFKQYPMSDGVLTLNAWENVLSTDKPAANVFMNILAGIGDKELSDKIKPQIDNLAPSSFDNLIGLLSAYATTYAATVATVNTFNIAYAFFTGKEPVISTVRAENNAIESVVPFKGVVDPVIAGATSMSSNPSGDILSEFKTPALDTQAAMINLMIFSSQKIQAMATGDVMGAYEADDKIEQAISALAPNFLKRANDFYDAVETGAVYSATQKGQVQYRLSKDKAESPLTVLMFGRGALGESQEYQELRTKVGDVIDKNDAAKQAFFKAIQAKDPTEKEKLLNVYKGLIKDGAKPVSASQIKEDQKKKQKNLLERTKEQVPKTQRGRL